MRKKCAYLFCTLFNNFVFVACTSIWLDRAKKKARERERGGRRGRAGDEDEDKDTGLQASGSALRLSSCRGDIKACYNFKIMQSCAKRVHCGAGNDDGQRKGKKGLRESVRGIESEVRESAWHQKFSHNVRVACDICVTWQQWDTNW